MNNYNLIVADLHRGLTLRRLWEW